MKVRDHDAGDQKVARIANASENAPEPKPQTQITSGRGYPDEDKCRQRQPPSDVIGRTTILPSEAASSLAHRAPGRLASFTVITANQGLRAIIHKLQSDLSGMNLAPAS